MTEEENNNQAQEESCEESINFAEIKKAVTEERTKFASPEHMQLLMGEHIRFKGLCEELAYMLKEYYVLKDITRQSNMITIEFLNGRKFRYTIQPTA